MNQKLKNTIIFLLTGIIILAIMEPAAWFETILFNFDVNMPMIYFKMGGLFALGVLSIIIGFINLFKFIFENLNS